MIRDCVCCGNAGSMSRFEIETFTIDHAGFSVAVEGFSGWRCAACEDVEFDADSARRYAAAVDAMMRREWEMQARELRRIRPTWIDSRCSRSADRRGHNAFSRYERSEGAPMPAVLNLFRILDKHPEH